MTDSLAVSTSRLRWLCRRGMLELDAWLALFLDTRYSDLPPELQAAFARLLDQDDMVLFDWLTGALEPPGEFQAVVDAIKTTRYQRP
ncbi:MAG: succinate dehydrogenase assembly factor 2 [Gammaproteobacteria bacterium]|nr:succinate dehydrogenase assembly factor 2 [Gammaproteobacteria bacterium]